MADYTTLNDVKLAIGANETTDDNLLMQFITDASRTIDRYCAGAMESDNYFAYETIENKIMRAFIGHDGVLRVRPLKAKVSNVSEIACRYAMSDAWISIPVDYVRIDGYTVSVSGMSYTPGELQVKITYTGGYDPIPADVANACTVLAARFYKEAKGGLTDAIGVAELGMLQYTRAIPIRVQFMLMPYRRLTP